MPTTQQKRILLFTDTPLRGGAELQMFLLAKFLDKTAFTPIVCCGPFPALDNWVKNLENEDIKVIRLPIKNKNDTSQIKLLKNIIKEEKIDLLHVHVWNPASGKFALLASKKAGIPTITTEHDPFKLNFLKNTFKRLTLNSVAKIITVSKNNKKFLTNLYPKHKDKIAVIHNGIDITWWKSQIISFGPTERARIRKEVFGLSPQSDNSSADNHLVALTVAELHERKGIQILIEAIKELENDESFGKIFAKLKFVIAGDGPHREKFEKMTRNLGLQNKINFLGRQKNIPRLMKSADFFILPSIREAFGMVILEAMLSNLPIIASETGGIPEIIDNNQIGLLVQPANQLALKETIKRLAKDSRFRARLSKNALEHVEKNFDATKMAREYEKIYSKI